MGLSIAAPVGPIGVLCMRRTLAYGRLHGLLSGLGAATADGVYGFIAAFGLTAISSLLINNATPLQLVGGFFLLYLGIRTLIERPTETTEKAGPETAPLQLSNAYLSTFALTITNPMTILAFLGIFAGLGVEIVAQDGTSALVMVGGVFVGSALWWLLLTSGVSVLRQRITKQHLLWINRFSGLVITVFAISILLDVLR